MKLFILLAASIPLAFGAEGSVQQKLLGAWDLVSYELRTPGGETRQTLGADPVGRISYDAQGRMSAQLMRRGVPKFASADRDAGTDAEVLTAFRGYIGYFGRYTVDEKAHTVTHLVEGAWFPNYVGTKQVRAYSFEGDRLILRADSVRGRATIVWKRAPGEGAQMTSGTPSKPR